MSSRQRTVRSHIFLSVLTYLPLSEVVLLQALNRTFYQERIPKYCALFEKVEKKTKKESREENLVRMGLSHMGFIIASNALPTNKDLVELRN